MECCWKKSLRRRPPIPAVPTVFWSWRRDLNPRPSDYKSDALPAELRQQSEISAPFAHISPNPFLMSGTIYKSTITAIDVQAMKLVPRFQGRRRLLVNGIMPHPAAFRGSAAGASMRIRRTFPILLVVVLIAAALTLLVQLRK